MGRRNVGAALRAKRRSTSITGTRSRSTAITASYLCSTDIQLHQHRPPPSRDVQCQASAGATVKDQPERCQGSGDAGTSSMTRNTTTASKPATPRVSDRAQENAETVYIGTRTIRRARSCDASRHPLGPTVDSRPAWDPGGVCAVDVHHPDVAILCRVGHVVIRETLQQQLRPYHPAIFELAPRRRAIAPRRPE